MYVKTGILPKFPGHIYNFGMAKCFLLYEHTNYNCAHESDQQF